MKKLHQVLLVGLMLPSLATAATKLNTNKGFAYPYESTTFNWTDVASGDFNGDGIDEIALINPDQSQLIMLSSPHDESFQHTAVYNGILPSANEYIGLTGGNFVEEPECNDVTNQTSFCRDEVAILRNVTDGTSANVLVYRQIDAANFELVASHKIGTGNYDWVDITAGDFDGNGIDEIVVAKKEWTQFITMSVDVSTKTLPYVTFRNISQDPAENDWRAMTAGDFNNDGRDELVAVRQGTASAKDVVIWDLYANGNWGYSQLAEYNHDYGLAHYDWQDVASGNLDGDTSNGDEFVLFKSTHTNFIFYNFNNGVISFGDFTDYDNETHNPWLGVAAGNMQLNNGSDELVMVRKYAGNTGKNIHLYSNNSVVNNKKQSVATGNVNGKSKMWSTYDFRELAAAGEYPGDPRIVEPETLRDFLVTNKIPAYNYLLSDYWAQNTHLSPVINRELMGKEYERFVEFLKLTEGTGIKVWVTLVPPSGAGVADVNYWAGHYHKASYPGDSPYISYYNQWGGLVTDERNLFNTAHGKPDGLNMIAWFKLLGIIGNRFPHLVGINIDDIGFNTSQYTPQYLGKMVRALREENESMVFAPVIYHRNLTDTYSYFRNYTDGFMYYFANERDKTTVTTPVGEECTPPTGYNYPWNFHGSNTPDQFYDGSGTSEIDDVKNWYKRSDKILLSGLYITQQNRSDSCVNRPTVERLMDLSIEQTDGVMLYTMIDRDVPEHADMAEGIYSKMAIWSGETSGSGGGSTNSSGLTASAKSCGWWDCASELVFDGQTFNFNSSWAMMVVDPETKSVTTTTAYDVLNTDSDRSRMITDMENIPYGHLVIVGTQDEPFGNSTDVRQALCQNFGACTYQNAIGWRDMYYMIGYKGQAAPLAEGKKSYQHGQVNFVASGDIVIDFAPPASNTASVKSCGWWDCVGKLTFNEHSMSLGSSWNMMVIEPSSKNVYSQASYSVHGNYNESVRFANDLAGIPHGYLVIVGTQDEPYSNSALVMQGLCDYFSACSYQNSIGFRGMYYMIGRKGYSPIAEGNKSYDYNAVPNHLLSGYKAINF